MTDARQAALDRAEAEQLMRAIAANLRCPMPPLLAQAVP